MNFITPKTDIFPEITWNEFGSILGSDYEQKLTIIIVYGTDSSGIKYIGTGHFINSKLEDVYEIEKENTDLFKDNANYWDDIRTNNGIIEQRAKNQNCDRITKKIIKP